MSLKKIDEVKKDRGFKIFDLIIYGVIAALVVALFIAVFATKDDGALQGFRIYLKEELVYEYSFKEEKCTYLGGDVEQSTDGDKLVLRVTSEGFNVVEVDKTARTVRVTDSDCGKRDCVYTPALRDNGGIIYCSPHRLRIVPFDYSDNDHIII